MMDTKKEIIDFINSNESNGALLITGKWGCGKSYLIKNLIREFNEEKKYAIAIISLFGINNVASLNYRIKEEYLELNSGVLGKTARKIYGAIGKVAKGGAEVTAAALPDSTTASAISTGIASVLSFNPLDYIPINNTVGSGEEKRDFVLVFDDFERSIIPIQELFGAINEYTENKRIKTILIADEEKIKEEKYVEFKEKLISRTTRLIPSFDEIIESIIKNYRETECGYINFMKRNTVAIKTIFAESMTENLRSLKSFLIDFERVFSCWNKSNISKEFLPVTFYVFGAMMFETKNGTYKKSKYGYIFADSDMQKKYKNWKGTYVLESLRQWITTGVWDEEEFIDEIKRKYYSTEATDDQKFLSHHFWDLEQSYIDMGMPLVVEKACKGELTRDELIDLLQKIHSFRNYAIPIPCDINYAKFEEGFKLRKRNILSNQIKEPKRRTFSEKHQIDEEAYNLYLAIEKFDDELIIHENKKMFYDFLDLRTEVTRYSFKGLSIGVFDEELLNYMLVKYRSAENYRKREIALTFLDLVFDDANCTSIEESIHNLSDLSSELCKYNTILNDYITIAINNSFIEKINSLVDELKGEDENIDEA